MSLKETETKTDARFDTDDWYRRAVEAAQIGTFELDLGSGELIYTDQLAAIFGLSGQKDLHHSKFADAIIPEDQRIRTEAHNIAHATGKLKYDARVRWPDDSIHWLRFNGTISFNELHEPLAIFGTVIDITEQRLEYSAQQHKLEEDSKSLLQLGAELKSSEEKFSRMIEEVQDYAILLLDIDGNILNWNKGAEKIKGYKESDIIGKNFRIFYQKQDQDEGLPETLINEAYTEGRAMHEGYRIRKDGSRFWGSVVITALHNKAGEVTSFIKVTRDLSDKKHAEDRLKHYSEELEIRNKELEQFAYIASHDLQEPLRKIQVFTGLLRKNIDDKDQVEKYFEKITSSAQRMSDLIESILKYSRSSPAATEMESVDLNLVLRAVKTDLELAIEEKKAIIQSDELPVIDAVESQIHQLMYNLISNSLKFADNDPVIKIRSSIISGNEKNQWFTFDPGQQYAELIFSDNGIGFEPEESARIFNAFMRLHGQRFAGSGIGLALCKKIVESHYGFIRAQSEPGNGAEFYVYLPISQQANNI